MPRTRILTPSDLTPEQAARMLDAINRFATAEELAAAVEIPGVLDIGIALARRILARRTQLGGAFRTLEQVATVPLIGPKRFSDLAVALTGVVPPELTLESLQDELLALRASLAGGGGGGGGGGEGAPSIHVALDVVVPRLYVGQRATLLVQAAAGGRPLADASVTLVTTWGTLRGSEAYGLQHGTSIRLRTDIDGVCRAVLEPRTLEPLRREQQSALETALEGLPADAGLPRAARDGLVEIARRYRRPESTALRTAVDVCFQTFAARAEAALNVIEPLSAWPLENATVIAHVQDGRGAEPGSAIAGSALVNLQLRNWLLAWLDVYRGEAEREARLAQGLGEVVAKGTSAGYVLGAAYGRIEQYVVQERGLVGQMVGRGLAEEVLGRFMREGITKLPEADRVAVRRGLGAAARTISAGGQQGTLLLAGLGAAQAGLRGELGSIGQGLDAKVAALDARVGGLRADLTRVDGLVGGLRVDLTRVDGLVGDLRVDTSAFAGELDVLGGDLVRLDRDLEAKLDVRAFDTDVGKIRDQLGGISSDLETLKRR